MNKQYSEIIRGAGIKFIYDNFLLFLFSEITSAKPCLTDHYQWIYG